MAKRESGGVPRSFGVPGFSLESILEECRDKAPEETRRAGNGGNGIPAGDGGLFLRAGGLPGRNGV